MDRDRTLLIAFLAFILGCFLGWVTGYSQPTEKRALNEAQKEIKLLWEMNELKKKQVDEINALSKN